MSTSTRAAETGLQIFDATVTQQAISVAARTQAADAYLIRRHWKCEAGCGLMSFGTLSGNCKPGIGPRASMHEDPGGLRIEINASAPLPLTFWEGADRTACRKFLEDRAGAGFDLNSSPLWRAYICRIGPDHHVFAIQIHHIIADAWSIEILQSDLLALYEALLHGRSSALPPLPRRPEPLA